MQRVAVFIRTGRYGKGEEIHLNMVGSQDEVDVACCQLENNMKKGWHYEKSVPVEELVARGFNTPYTRV